LEALKETNDKAPYFPLAWAKRGNLELEFGDIEEAEASFETALEYDNDEIEALLGIASIYVQLDSTEKRADEIRVLTKLDELAGLDSWYSPFQ
jgi:tetratricopeptide (TPR) repeat protein